MNKPSTDKRIGASVGRYTVHGVIGTGGMANVYAATDDAGGWCAVKILHRALATDEVAVARFFEEAYLVNRVKHPGVCRIVDDGVTEDRCPFLVMDLLNGETLESRIEGEVKLPVVDVLDIGIDVADTLTAVHEAGIIHRDLKPANLFLTFSGAVKLLDFGVGKGKALAGKTVEGMLLGTPSYMSPEQAVGSGTDKVDARSDVYSLGAVLFRLVSGETVHVADDSYRRWFAAATEHARSLVEAAPSTHPSVVAVIDTALMFEKEDRWPSASAFLSALRDAKRAVVASSAAPGVAPMGSFISMLNDLKDPD